MAPSSLSSEPGALPSLRTRLYGRERDCTTALHFLLDEAVPLLTFTGPGGVGKTSLALAIAHQARASFADGVIWIDLMAASEPAQVPVRIATAVGIELPDTSEEEAATALIAALQAQQRLLLLDNCEHVAAVAGELLDRLLAFCPAVQVLATSRVPFNIRGEQRWRLEPLPVPRAGENRVEELADNASVRLFLDRARSRLPSLEFDASNAPSIAALCRHLEGMPLAIELAATQIGIFSPESLLAAVQDGGVQPAGNLVGLPERQQSIAATIAWSYGLLSPDGRRLFRRLSIFAGSCTLEAALAISSWEPARSTRALHELVESNLIARGEHVPEHRFIMLESMQAFALARLREEGEEQRARQAHAAHFTDYFARSYPDILGANAHLWLQRFYLELENIRAAFTWLFAQRDGIGAMRLLAATDDYWSYSKHRVESRAWAETALLLAPEAPAALRSIVLHIATFSARSLGDFSAAVALAEQGLAAAQQSGEPVAVGRAYYQLGNARHHVDPGHAVNATRNAVCTFRQANDPIWLAVVLADLGDKLRDCGRVDEAIPLLNEGLTLNRTVCSPWGIAQALGQRAHAFLVQGDLTRAAADFAESIPLAQEIGDEHMVMGAVVGLAGVALERGFPVAAASLMGAVDAEQQATGWPRVSHPIPAARIRETVVAALDESVWNTATAYGRTLPFPDAVTAALAIASGEDEGLRLLERAVTLPANHESATSSIAGTGATGFAEGPELSWRELEVLTLLCQRSTNAEMAKTLFVSPRTIESHVSHILEKLSVRNRREAAAQAVKQGLISLPPT